MANPRPSPIYFPEFGTLVNPSIFTGGISERRQANFECTTYDVIEQHWSAADTVTFQLNDVSTGSYRININGDTYNGTVADSPAPSSVVNWSIPLATYAGKTIRMVLEIDLGVSWAAVSTSPYMEVHHTTDCFLDQTRLITFWGEGFEVGTYYSDDAESPNFQQILRVPASLRFDSLEFNDSIVQRDRDGAFNVCYNSTDNVRSFSTAHIPLWMHEVLNYIAQHRKITIDGTRYVFNSPFRRNRQIKGTSMFTGDMTFKMAEHLSTTTRAN